MKLELLVDKLYDATHRLTTDEPVDPVVYISIPKDAKVSHNGYITVKITDVVPVRGDPGSIILKHTPDNGTE